MEQLIFLAIAILYGIGVGIYRLIKFAKRQLSGGALRNPIPQAIDEAQRQAQTPQQPAAQPQALPNRSSSLMPARPLPRQPQAGGPLIPREATERDFRRQEQELIAEEPAPLGVSLSSTIPSPLRPARSLFSSNDDLVRAIILQEALGPPLSRRRPPSP